MTQQIHTLQVGGPGFSLGARESLLSHGMRSGDEGRGERVLFAAQGKWKVGLAAPDAGTQFVVIDEATTIDLVNDRIPYPDHRFMDREPVVFAGQQANRPTVASPYGVGGGAGAIRNDVQYYVKVVDKDTIEIHGSADLNAKVDFTSQGTNWDMRRYPYHYVEETIGGNSGYQTYNVIGAPTESTGDRFPSDNKHWDTGFDVPPLALALGGQLQGEVRFMMRQCAPETRDLVFVVDLDPDVRADGMTGELIGLATVVASTDVWTLTAHGLLNGEVVKTRDNHATAPGATAGPNYFVKRLSADTFQLCTDEALTTVVNSGSDGNAVIAKQASGSKNQIKFRLPVPNTVSNVASFTVTDASWDDGTLLLSATGAFANYTPRVSTVPDGSVGDVLVPTSTDGGWDTGERVSVFAKVDDDTLEVADDGLATLPSSHAGEADMTLIQVDYVPATLRWTISKDIGDLSTTTGSDTYIADAVLEVGGEVIRDSVSRTFPRRGTNYVETRRFDWGPVSRIRYYPAGALPTFRFAADEEITGADSAAVGIVVDHDQKRQTVLYRPKSLSNDFIPGEDVTGSSGTLTLEGPIEKGPLPTRVSQRFAVSGAYDGRFEVIANHCRVTLVPAPVGG